MYEEGTNPILGVWVALFLFLFVGWCVNKLSGKPRMNWSAWLGGYYLLGFVMSVVVIFTKPVDTYHELGKHIAYYLIPAAIAIAYAKTWRKKNPMSGRQPTFSELAAAERAKQENDN